MRKRLSRYVSNLRSDLYMMRAYHLYEGTTIVTLKDMINDMDHGGFILFGKRMDGKAFSKAEWPTFAAISAGEPCAKYVAGKELLYTIDTGNGYRCKNYEFVVTGWLMVKSDLTVGISHGEVPALTDRLNAYVFK